MFIGLQGYALAAVAQPPAVTFQQLASRFVIMLGFILFSSMGIADGLVFRRVRLRYGVVILSTFRGLVAQLIGVVCIFTALFGLYLVGQYVVMLGRYCQGGAGCLVTTPIAGLFAHWMITLAIGAILFCFIVWARSRWAEVAAPTAVHTDTTTSSYSLPNIYRNVNDKLALARLPRMNRPEVEQIMEFVEQHAPFVVLSGAKQVMDEKELNQSKLAAVFLTDERFRNKGQRERIALEAVTEAYVATRQPH